MTWPGTSPGAATFYPWHEPQVNVGGQTQPSANPKSYSPPYQLSVPLAPLEYHHHHHYANTSPLPLTASVVNNSGELSPYHHAAQLQTLSSSHHQQQGSPTGAGGPSGYDCKDRDEVGGGIKWSPLTPPPTQAPHGPGISFGLKIEGN